MVGSGLRRLSSYSGHALYVSPHQDDEQLSYGAAIRADCEAGRFVSVLLVTDGRWGNSRTNPVLESRLGYVPDFPEYSAARDREFVESCLRLGAHPILPPSTDRLQDGFATKAGVKSLIQRYASPGSMLRGTSQYDGHNDHLRVGEALVELFNEGFGTDLVLLLSSRSVNEQGHVPPPGTPLYSIDNPPFPLTYQWPYRNVDVANGWWGIGYLDVPSMFNAISGTDPDTYWHEYV